MFFGLGLFGAAVTLFLVAYFALRYSRGEKREREIPCDNARL